ncbi:maleylpyruvate isomerase N-terminal domain-containing protein [Streptomyces flaveolus]|uniref:maleylpyruvate isomerase N-terminal domain-containing protein n=1 Tax=Streptomyces flaveolus TaxID=67297 RepID=UPI0034412A8F
MLSALGGSRGDIHNRGTKWQGHRDSEGVLTSDPAPVRNADEGSGAPVPVAASTDRFVATVTTLTDAQATGGTLIPPWTRGHVVTHVARATDSLCRLLDWARTGVETPSTRAWTPAPRRSKPGPGPVADLVADVEDSAARFEAAVRSLPPAAWHAEVRMRTGEPRTPATLIPTRLR